MKYEVDVTREGKNWLATVRDLPGAHTYAGNLTALRENVFEVIALVNDTDDADRAPLGWNFTDPADKLIAEAALVGAEREDAEAALAATQVASSAMAQRLVDAAYSVRDIAGALRLTPGRVSQMTKERRSWVVFFERPTMPRVGSMSVVAVQEDDEGKLPARLYDPLDTSGEPVRGTWIYSGKDDQNHVAIYELAEALDG